MNELLQDSLEGLHKKGGRHVDLLLTDQTITEYYQLRQQILQKRSEAIQQAITQIDAQFDQELWQLEQEYGVYVNMITPHGD